VSDCETRQNLIHGNLSIDFSHLDHPLVLVFSTLVLGTLLMYCLKPSGIVNNSSHHT
jgi:hypothetical protein